MRRNPKQNIGRKDQSVSKSRTRTQAFKTSLLAALVMASLAVGAAPSAASFPDGSIPLGAMALDDNDSACPTDGLGDLTPAAIDTAVTPAEEFALDVLILLDGVLKKEATRIVVAAQAAYDPLHIRLVPTFKRFPIESEGIAKDGQPTARDGYLLEQIWSVYPSAPQGIDVVHLLTAKDLLKMSADPNSEGDELAGSAACVGGIRFDGTEFSISETRFRYAEVAAPKDDFHAIILAHEIGHVLGAHHHYGNCVEGREMATNPEGFCTVMSAALPMYNSLKFGTLESRVIRGYTEAHAAP